MRDFANLKSASSGDTVPPLSRPDSNHPGENREQLYLRIDKKLYIWSNRPTLAVNSYDLRRRIMSDVFQELGKAVQDGDEDKVKELVAKAIDQGMGPMDILEKGLRPVMEELGKKFERLEIFLPALMVAADAMTAGVEILRPHLAAGSGGEKKGRVVLGTVHGDVHRIGKDIVRIMLDGAGFDVVDLGHDVPDLTFVEKIRELEPDILGMSALMTTTMQNMPRVIQALEESGLREKVKIIVGGAPILPDWAEKIGADGYGENASEAVKVSKELIM